MFYNREIISKCLNKIVEGAPVQTCSHDIISAININILLLLLQNHDFIEISILRKIILFYNREIISKCLNKIVEGAPVQTCSHDIISAININIILLLLQNHEFIEISILRKIILFYNREIIFGH